MQSRAVGREGVSCAEMKPPAWSDAQPTRLDQAGSLTFRTWSKRMRAALRSRWSGDGVLVALGAAWPATDQPVHSASMPPILRPSWAVRRDRRRSPRKVTMSSSGRPSSQRQTRKGFCTVIRAKRCQVSTGRSHGRSLDALTRRVQLRRSIGGKRNGSLVHSVELLQLRDSASTSGWPAPRRERRWRMIVSNVAISNDGVRTYLLAEFCPRRLFVSSDSRAISMRCAA